ncbi:MULTISPECIES: hypothetical protein [unclassified Brevundimonas]|uniref:hypothetical protein n=1 Tax=unclassified Brevundimonas TaxID=2622653 RepID=UPI0025C5CFCB|nr:MULTISPECIES: hypothetical protein [unclassified Brevundimonas]
MSSVRIPKREPEVVKAEADRFHSGDDEKVPTTTVGDVSVDGVSISSRYDKAHELKIMVSVVEALPLKYRTLINSVFCDSKAQACYSVELNPCSRVQAEKLAAKFEELIMSHSSGHNGVYFNGAAGTSLVLDPNWPFEEGLDDEAE